MDFEKLDKIPTSILKDVTIKPSEEKPTQNENTSQKSSGNLEDILKGNSNTKIPISSISDPTNINATTTNLQGNNSIAVGELMESKLAIELIDAILPSLFVAIFYSLSVKLRKTELQLTEKEKNVIAPVMQKCLNSIMLNFNSPWTTLAVTLGVIYGSKITERGVVTWIDKMNEKKEIEALEERTGIRKTPVVPIRNTDRTRAATEAKMEQSQAKKTFEGFKKMAESVPIDMDFLDTPTKPIQETLGTITDRPLVTELKPYGEADIRAMMKKRSVGRERAMKMLDRQYNLR